MRDGRLWLGAVPLPHFDVALVALRAVDWRAATDVGAARGKAAETPAHARHRRPADHERVPR